MRLILARHGQTLWNQERRAQGLSDVELSPEGQRQAQRLAQALKEEPIEAVYASPLRRALDTAQAIATQHDLEVHLDPRFQEMHLGDMEGLTGEQMRARHPELLHQWGLAPAEVRMPGGETLAELQERMWAAIQDVLSRHQGQVVAVSHNFAILTVLCRAIGLDLDQFRRLRMETAATATLDFGPLGPVLLSLNETCHLKGETPVGPHPLLPP